MHYYQEHNMNHSNTLSLSFPEAKTIIVSGDIHGDFNQLVFKLCIQYKLTDTLLIVAGDCGFGFEKKKYSAINEQVQNNCSQEVSSNNSITETQPVILVRMPDSLGKYESILVEEQLKEVKQKRDTMIAIREYVVEKTSKYLSKENISTLFYNIKCLAENLDADCQQIHSTKESKLSSPSLRHLAWNIGERLGVSRRDRAIFIKSSFPYELRNANIEYLKANLRVNAPCDIPIDVPDKGDFRFHNNT